MGYAFINFIDSAFILDFYHEYNNSRWSTFNSEKVCRIAYGRIQGKRKLIRHFEKSKVWKNPNQNIKPLVINTKKVEESEIQEILDNYYRKRFKETTQLDEHKEDINFEKESKILENEEQTNGKYLNQNLTSTNEGVEDAKEEAIDESILFKVTGKRNSSKPKGV